MGRYGGTDQFDPDVGARNLRGARGIFENSGPFSLKENDAPLDVSRSLAGRAGAETGFPHRCF
ncbi:MAG: hypothetical protein ACJAWM_001534 [Sulfitobacter sp.]|jgi:hypothetical protein